MKRLTGERGKELLATAFLLLCFLSSVYLACRTAPYIFDADASAELVLSRLLSEQGGMLSGDWYYSTELRVINTQLIYAPLFRVFSDWSTVRWVGAAVLQAVLVLSFLFCARQAGIRRSVRLVCAGLLLLPASTAYARIVLMHCFYIPHVAIGFFLIGLLLGSLRGGRGRGLYGAGFLLLSFLAGLGGVRQLMVTLVPLLLLSFVLLFLNPPTAEILADYNGRREARLPATLRAVAGAVPGRGFFLSLLGSVVCALGYAVNLKVLCRFFPFFDYSQLQLRLPAVSTLKALLWNYFELFGYHERASAVSLDGVASLCGLAVLACALVFTLRFLLRRTRPQSYALQLSGLAFAFCLLTLSLFLLLTQREDIRYLLPAMPLLMLLLAAVWEQAELRPAQLQRLVALALCCCCALGGVAVDRYLIADHSGSEVRGGSAITYSGLMFSEVDHIRLLTPAVRYLTENGYTYGYATFWNGNVCTEASDGQLRMVNLHDALEGELPSYYFWLMPKDYPEKAHAAEKPFLLLRNGEYALWADKPWLADAQEVYADEHFTVLDIPPDGALYATLNPA